MKFICSSCGAEIDDLMPKCPFCDTLIPKGAEMAYMDKLYDIQEDLEELNEIPLETAKEEFRNQGKKMKRVCLVTLIILSIAALFWMWEEKKYDRDRTADYIWEQANYPIMNELYESGKYEELEEMYNSALMDDKPLWNWKYFDEYSKIYDALLERE